METYQEIVEKIECARRFGKEPGVVVTRRVLDQLSFGEQGLFYVHVAGTNGKGSTCAFLEALAKDAGYRVGKFISPHLIRFNERITVDGRQISDEAVCRLGGYLLSRDFGVDLTMFDYCFVMALLYFQEQKCDFVILETGLGGRLDSTRALRVKPAASVITRIGYDHMGILGDTLREIATEKAGIIREGVPVVLAPQEKEALDELRAHCERELLYEVRPDDCSVGIVSRTAPEERLCRKVREDVERYAPEFRMRGAYQRENAAAALLTSMLLFPEKCNPAALVNAEWAGRMQILSENPFVMVDGAHNPNGVHALAESLKELYPGECFRFVMGVMADKDYVTMIEELMPLALDFVTVTPESGRALEGNKLAELICERGVPARFEKDCKKLFAEPAEQSGKTICFGSLYFIGMILEIFTIENQR